jgi:hypothetical protein
MTVRAWFTISGLVLVALLAAVAFRFFMPAAVAPPAIIGHVGAVRLDGDRLYSCWPQRSERLKCRRERAAPRAETVPAAGTLRFVVAYPAQPVSWQVTVVSDEDTVLFKNAGTVKYKLDPGTYLVDTQARYDRGAVVHYWFRLRVTRSGS